MVTTHPGGGVGDEGKAGRVAFGEAILTEAADLVEDLFGELPVDPPCEHAGNEPVVVLFDAAGFPPCGHVPAKLVGLARGIPGGDYRKLHYLLLKNRHAERLPEHRFEVRMWIDHRLLAVASPQVGVHHAAGDGAGTHDAHLDDDIVVACRTEPWKHRHLCPAFKLEDSHRIARGDHGIGGRVSGRNCRHGELRAALFPEQPEAVIQVRQGAKAEQIDLEQIHGFNIVLVPLNHRAAGHCRVFDRDDMAHRLAAEHETSGVDREVTREVADLPAELREQRDGPGGGVEPRLGERRIEVAVTVGDQAREPVGGGRRYVEHLSHIAHGGLEPVADDVCNHGGMGTAVLVVHVLDDLFAAVVLYVQIDVGRLGAFAGEKALEQQLHSHRINGGDAEAEADRRVRRRAPALAENALPPAELDDLPHRQEVAAIVEIADDGELFLELSPDALRYSGRITLVCAFKGEAAQPADGRVAVREAFGRVAVDDLVEAEGALAGDLHGSGEQLGRIGVAATHLLRRCERVFGICLEPVARLVDGAIVAYAGEHVLQRPPGRIVVENLLEGDERNRR